MAIKLVSVDCGRNGVKAICAGAREYFPAAVSPYRKLRLERDLEHDDMIVEYRGERYYVGGIARDESIGGSQMFTATKVHADTRILTLTALHRVCRDESSSIFLVTGAPIETRNEAEKGGLKRLLTGAHEITVNSVKRTYNIVRVEVAAEAATPAWALKRKGTYVVVDPGSRTVNFATSRDGRWVDHLSGTLDYGLDTTESLTRTQFVRMLVADLSRKLRTIPPVVLIGGMAPQLLTYFAEYHPEVEMHPDYLFANAMSFYALGVQACEKANAEGVSQKR